MPVELLLADEPALPELLLAVAVAVLVLALKFPAADVPATMLELTTGTKVVFKPTGIPGAVETKVAADAMEVTTLGWVVMGRGWEVAALGWPVTTPREFVRET